MNETIEKTMKELQEKFNEISKKDISKEYIIVYLQ